MISTLCPSPIQMSSRRVPLNTLASNVNSPFTNANSSATVPLKRQIRTTQGTKESVYGQPPAKRQALESDVQRERETLNALAKTVLRTPSKQTNSAALEVRRDANHQPAAIHNGSRIKPRTRTGDPPPAFQLEKLKPRPASTMPPAAVSNAKKTLPETNAEAVENIRTWQRHYRKVFPSYVFFFESVPEESKNKCIKTVNTLHSRVEPFFSKEITHVITMRAIPTKHHSSAPKVPQTPKRGSKDQTINPQLLEKNSESTSKTGSGRASTSSRDVLLRAQEYDMKIWTFEKFDRILQTIMDPVPTKVSQGQVSLSNSRTKDHRSAGRPDSLARALREEKLHGPMDRDHTAATNDMVYFQGPYIMVADMTKVHRPILMREYPKATNKDEITWPRFRSTGQGRCPWIEDPNKKAAKREAEEKKRLQEDEKLKEQDDFLQKEKALKEALRRQHTEKVQNELNKAARNLTECRGEYRVTKPSRNVAKVSTNMSPPPRRMSATTERSKDINEVMREITSGSRKASSVSLSHPVKKETDSQRPFSITTQKDSVRVKATTTDRNFPPRAQIQTSGDERPHRVSRMYEPVASGLQISNATSAIRSQVISSNAAQMGSKAGTSKDMFTLKRKVFEKTNGNAESGRVSHANASAPVKRRSSNLDDKENYLKRPGSVATVKKAETAVAPVEKKVATPGYCENCREKFDDFDDHVQSRKHKRFAEDNSNWEELDDLLEHLQRPERRRWYSP